MPQTPVHMTEAPKGPPDRYIALTSLHHCTNCQCTTETTQTFACVALRATGKGGAERYVQHMIPVDRLSYNVPLEVRRHAATKTALCALCLTKADLTYLPKPVYDRKLVVAVRQDPDEGKTARRHSEAAIRRARPALDILEL